MLPKIYPAIVQRLFKTPHDYLSYVDIHNDLAEWLHLQPASLRKHTKIQLGSDHHYRQTLIPELVCKLKYKTQIMNTYNTPIYIARSIPRMLPYSCLSARLLAKTVDLDLDPRIPLPLRWLKDLSHHKSTQLNYIVDNLLLSHPVKVKRTYSDSDRQIRNSPTLTVIDIPCAFKQYLHPSNRIYNQGTPTPSAELARIKEIDRLETKLQNLEQSKQYEKDRLTTLQDKTTSLVIKRGGRSLEVNTRRKVDKANRFIDDNSLSVSVKDENDEWLRDSEGNLVTKSLDVASLENGLNDDYAEEAALRRERREGQVLRDRISYDIQAASTRLDEFNKYPNDVAETANGVKIKKYYDGQSTKQSWLSGIPEAFHWLAETSEPNIKKGKFLPPFHLVSEMEEIPNIPIFTLSPGGGLPGDFIYTDAVEFDKAVSTNFYRVFVLASRSLCRDVIFRETVRMINASNGIVLLV